MHWKAEISIAEAGSLSMVKIISAKMLNHSNGIQADLYNNSTDLTDGLLDVSSENVIRLDMSEKKLLPDSIVLKYFSVDERKFYEIRDAIPYIKLMKIAKENSGMPVLMLKIAEKGKLYLRMGTAGGKREASYVQSYNAVQTNEPVEAIVHKISWNGNYTEYKNINDPANISDLLLMEIPWSIHIETDHDAAFTNVRANSHTGENLVQNEDFDEVVRRKIPQTIFVTVKNDVDKYLFYRFDAAEILNAFTVLHAQEPSESLLFTMKILKNAKTQCVVSKNGVSIPLKNIHAKFEK